VHCLFCQSEGPFADEHIIPASLGNDEHILSGQVCAKCNDHFSRKVERPVLSQSPIAFWRTFLGIKTRRGRLPAVDLAQPKERKGRFPGAHPAHDDGIAFAAHEDGSASVDISDPEIVRQVLCGERTRFQFVFTPNILRCMGRFLCKIGVELLCYSDPRYAREPKFDQARQFARFGELKGLWPIFHFVAGDIGALRHRRNDGEGLVEDVHCYSFTILETPGGSVFVRLGVGTDNWIVCLNDPDPTPEIALVFPDRDLALIWYSAEELE